MSKTRKSTLPAFGVAACVAALVLGAAAPVAAESSIAPASPYAWGENIGWVNFRGDGPNGVVVTPNYLSGYAWSENFGWINLGEVPQNLTQYSQGLGDTGVNNDGAGNLTGWAWGENIGWIAFDTSGDGGSQVTIDGLGQFQGYAWGENVGWITMNSGFGVVNQTPPSSVIGWMLM